MQRAAERKLRLTLDSQANSLGRLTATASATAGHGGFFAETDPEARTTIQKRDNQYEDQEIYEALDKIQKEVVRAEKNAQRENEPKMLRLKAHLSHVTEKTQTIKESKEKAEWDRIVDLVNKERETEGHLEAFWADLRKKRLDKLKQREKKTRTNEMRKVTALRDHLSSKEKRFEDKEHKFADRKKEEEQKQHEERALKRELAFLKRSQICDNILENERRRLENLDHLVEKQRQNMEEMQLMKAKQQSMHDIRM
jgi:hypothetical protein